LQRQNLQGNRLPGGNATKEKIPKSKKTKTKVEVTSFCLVFLFEVVLSKNLRIFYWTIKKKFN